LHTFVEQQQTAENGTSRCCWHIANVYRFSFFLGLYVKALGYGVDEILDAYRRKLLRIEEEVIYGVYTK